MTETPVYILTTTNTDTDLGQLPARNEPGDLPKRKFSSYYGSSIGPAEQDVIPNRVYKESDRVVKNFCTEVKTSVDAVRDVLSRVENTPLMEGARLNIRFITTLEALAEAMHGTEWRKYIEGVTPLSGCGVPDLEGMCIVNLGRNHEARAFDKQRFEKLLGDAQHIFVSGNGSTNLHVLHPGYTYATFDSKSGAEYKQKVSNMLVKFAWDKDEADEIVESSEFKFGLMIYTETGEVASLIGIESRTLTLDIDGKKVYLQVQEVAEAKTAAEHTQRGLYGYVNTEIMRQAVVSSAVPDILIGEINLHSPGHAAVKNAFIVQRRKCGLMDPAIRARLGMSGPSALRADFTIKGANGKGAGDDALADNQANSLLPTYQTRVMILNTYGGSSKQL
ncbi:MAG: hypothetical protein WCO78_01830 [Candidatus Roizmanbacteria bacterium]